MSFGDEQYPAGQGKLTYGSYLRIAELISLQQRLSEPEQHDELLFIVIHQIYELWFKQLLYELETVARCLDEDRLELAIRLMSRSVEIVKVLVAQVSVLETMMPMDFLEFRDHLKPASGFQSAQFRELEFLCALKDSDKLANYDEGSPERQSLERRLAEPSLPEVFRVLLSRHGLCGQASDAGVHSAIARIYAEPEKYHCLFQLAERLLDFDEQLLFWRQRHVAMVERMIGDKEGTGGSAGAAYLRTTLAKRCFPELWAVRNQMNRRG